MLDFDKPAQWAKRAIIAGKIMELFFHADNFNYQMHLLINIARNTIIYHIFLEHLIILYFCSKIILNIYTNYDKSNGLHYFKSKMHMRLVLPLHTHILQKNGIVNVM